MRNYFGTDGIRGIANDFLTGDLAFRCGNALSQMKVAPLILVGRDTRVSGDMLSLSLSAGALSGGAAVYDLGIMPTAGVAYLTRQLKADFGVVISASHNTPEYNGIKVFSREGYKLDEETESRIEHKMNAPVYADNAAIGRYCQKFQLADLYISGILEACRDGLSGMKIALDCSNGAAYKIAPSVFARLGADVSLMGVSKAGVDINADCGSLHPEKLAKLVREQNCDIGFAFDGDSDRLIAIDERGEVVDGDKLIYMFACSFKERGTLKNDIAVGTTHTNMGVQKALESKGIKLLRSDIGDKYVLETMLKEDGVVGGEQSGHIILRDFATTGDGILAAVACARILKRNAKKLSELTDVRLFPQENINIRVIDKLRVLGSDKLTEALEAEREYLGGRGRIIVRASGTEQLIRVFAETENAELSAESASRIAELIKGLNY